MNKYQNHIFVINILIHLSAFNLAAQTSPDSLYWSDEQLEQELYEINLAHFKRLLADIELDSTLKIQVSHYSNEFIQQAQSGQYGNANVILESILTLLQNKIVITSDEDIPIEIDEGEQPTTASDFQWLNAITIGSDSWKQQFDISIPETDSSIVEEDFNPSVQLQLGFRYDQAKYQLLMNGQFKNSRDYMTGIVKFDVTKRVSDKFYVHLKDQFDQTRYKEEIDLRYWQNGISADVHASSIGPCSFDLFHEFLVRMNTPESSSYSDYYQNRVRVNSCYQNGSHLLLAAEYEWEWKWHPLYLEKDYQEHQLGVSGFGLIGWRFNYHADITTQWRDYSAVFNDTSFYNDYREVTANVSSSFRYNDIVSLRVDASLEQRRYGQMNAVTTDYFESNVEPAFVFNVRDNWEFQLGYVYDSRNYSDVSSVNYLLEEDYYSHGISLSIDVLRLNSFILSLSDTYAIKRYPNSAANDVESFTLYTDRNTNSLLLFFTWNITSQLELGVLANYDTDRDPYQEQSDAQSTLFSVELTYMF